ncbi:MAG TPA: triose-phosphate isomerase, partial [Gemmatimonadales bacterium]|nr:triose-phosphate isomerase [Gemmatimonadales bacterium]
TRYRRHEDRAVWFFPPAVSLEAAAEAVREREDLLVGVQGIHWEAKGAFTGAVSAPLAVQAGAKAALIGHSERRQLFGETDEDTRKKTAAALAAGLVPMLCIGETLAERDAGHTLPVVKRQLTGALGGLDGGALRRVVIAYEPVWAIGTGRNATPQDAALVHREIRSWLAAHGAGETRVVYGGSVSLKNIAELLAEPELDGALVGGASLNPESWAELVQTAVG